MKRTFSTRRLSGSSILFLVLASVSVVLLVLSSTGRMAPVEGAMSAQSPGPSSRSSTTSGDRSTTSPPPCAICRRCAPRTAGFRPPVDTLTIDNARLTEVQTENQQLRELLRFRQLNPYYDFRGGQLIARVISRGPTNYLSALSIDLGSDQGIARGHAGGHRARAGRTHPEGRADHLHGAADDRPIERRPGHDQAREQPGGRRRQRPGGHAARDGLHRAGSRRRGRRRGRLRRAWAATSPRT